MDSEQVLSDSHYPQLLLSSREQAAELRVAKEHTLAWDSLARSGDALCVCAAFGRSLQILRFCVDRPAQTFLHQALALP